MSAPRYKIETVRDVLGTRWWVNCWTDSTPFHALGASEVRPAPVNAESLELAKAEARSSLAAGR